MYADTADYGEWKFGRRTTGLVFSALVFSQKVGLAMGTGALGWLLAYYGFVANADQTAGLEPWDPPAVQRHSRRPGACWAPSPSSSTRSPT